MHNVSKDCVQAERALGHDSILFDALNETDEWANALDADVHVEHTFFPVTFKKQAMRKQLMKPLKHAYVVHGTPEHVFQGSVEAATNGRYAPPNSFMMLQEGLRTANAVITFWARHKWIFDSMMGNGRQADLVPMGVDVAFWRGGISKGKYQGAPSVYTSENCHYIKWPLDLFLMWPMIYPEVPEAYLHACYLPQDLHKHFMPLVSANGCWYRAHIGPWTYPHESLRDILASVDFYCGLVRYGDLNHMSLQANAAGATTISYTGNPHSDFWVPEGDQRDMAKAMIEILNGRVEKRAKTPVPDLSEQGKAMVAVYERILDAPPAIMVPQIGLVA